MTIAAHPVVPLPLRQAANELEVQELGPPMCTPGALLIPGKWRGRPVMLKLSLHTDEQAAAALLAAWQDAPVVRVLARTERALVLERLLPGRNLEDRWALEHDRETLAVIADVASTLCRANIAISKVPDALQRGRALLHGPRPPSLSPELWHDARCRYAQLARSQRDVRVGHGDLHHGNILWDDRRGWVAIDPKGVRAELAYELACGLRNPITLVRDWAKPRLLGYRIVHASQVTGLDSARVLGWAYAQAVLAAAWAYDDGQPVDPWLQAVAAFGPLLGHAHTATKKPSSG